MFTNEFKKFFEQNRKVIRKKRTWGKYIHSVNFRMIRSQIPPNTTVLAIGPWVSDLFPMIKVSEGYGVDPYTEKHELNASSNVHIYHDFEEIKYLNKKFDCIILSFSIGMMEDILDSFKYLRKFCTPDTRLFTTYYSRAWQPFIKLAEVFGLRIKTPESNWVPISEIENLMFLADFQVIKRSMFCLAPIKIPLVSDFINKFISSLPLINCAGVITLEVGRPINLIDHRNANILPEVSIIVPARNEAGNIAEIVRRIPNFPGGEEIVFVEGYSTDNTRDAIKQAIRDHPHRRISFLTQDGKGKKDAVEKGFSHAKGEILAILDADITVSPESLPKFVEVLISGKGEFVNGSRMVYPMRGRAMRFLNLLANIFFSWVFSYLLNQQVRDTLCGTKVLRKKDYRRIVDNRSYFGDFDPFGDFDLLFGATHLNLKIIDLPVRYEERRYGNTNIRRWRDGLYLLRMVLFGMRKFKFKEIFFDNLSKKQQESWWGHKTYAGQQRLVRRSKLAADFLAPVYTEKVLEIGCGSGDFTVYLLERLSPCSYYGMDISAGLLEIARKRTNKSGVVFIKGDVENIDPDLGDFNAVIGTSVLHHLDVPKTLSRIYKRLTPGGKIFFLEPNMMNPQIWLERNVKFIGRMMQNTEDETAFYNKDMVEMLKDCGFVHISVVPFDFMHPIIPKPVASVLDAIFMFLESMPLVKEFAGSLMIKSEKPA